LVSAPSKKSFSSVSSNGMAFQQAGLCELPCRSAAFQTPKYPRQEKYPGENQDTLRLPPQDLAFLVRLRTQQYEIPNVYCGFAPFLGCLWMA
jgi:hypothetical protein